MEKVKEIKNVKSGLSFSYPGNDLIAYAKQDPSTFVFIHEDDPTEEVKKQTFCEDELKAMSMKDLQTIADGYDLECDRRVKDKLIDAILVTHGR